MTTEIVFYFDFNSPYAYLAATRIEDLIPDAEWRPIAFPAILMQLGRLEDFMAEDFGAVTDEVSERVSQRGLPAFKPPPGWPLETWSFAPLRAALFAAERGRLREFSHAAYRKVFAESRSLTELNNVLEAAREAGLDPDQVEDSIQRPEIKERLKDHTQEALASGITGIPTVAVGDELFWGDDRLEQAAAASHRP